MAPLRFVSLALLVGLAAGQAAGSIEGGEPGPSGRLALWAKLQAAADEGRTVDPATPDIEMTSVTGPEVNLDSATGATGAAGLEGPSATGGATGPAATSGTGSEGVDVAPELRAKFSEFGSRMLSLFTANSTDTDASKFQGSAERIMRNMTMDEIVTAMALDDMQAKDVAAMGLDQMVLAAFGQAPSAAPEPGAKVDPAVEKARAAEVAVSVAEKAVSAITYTHAVTAEMTIGGYDKASFRAAEQDAFKAYVAKVTESKNGAVKIDTLAQVGATLRRRRLLAAGKLKIGFSVLSTGADAGGKAAAAINKLKDSPAAAVQGLKDAGLGGVTSVEVTKAATVITTVESQAAQFRLHKAIEDAADAQETLASSGKKLPAAGAAKPKKKLKLRVGAGHWQWVLNHKKQWTLSGRADAFWARQQAKVRAIMEAKEKAADTTGAAAATGGAAPAAF